MTGKIRARGRCECGSAFKVIEEVDIFCPQCGKKPKAFYVWLYLQKKKYKFYRDREGHILDTFKRAEA